MPLKLYEEDQQHLDLLKITSSDVSEKPHHNKHHHKQYDLASLPHQMGTAQLPNTAKQPRTGPRIPPL